MDKSKQARLKRIYRAQAEMQQGQHKPVLKQDLIQGGEMDYMYDSNGEPMGYGLIFKKHNITPEMLNIHNVGLGLVGGAADKKRKISAYNVFMREHQAAIRKKLEKKGFKGKDLNTAVMVEIGAMWKKSKK